MRLFVALELPAEAVAALAAFRARADAGVWRPVADEALHLTLAFLGRRPAEDAQRVGELLHGVAVAAPRLRLGGALALPPRCPRVLAAEVEDRDGTLATLQAEVGGRLQESGLYEPEARRFRPHVTVARLRSGARVRPAQPERLVGPEPVPFRGLAVTLYESRLEQAGARYLAHTSVPLPPAQAQH